MGETYYCDNYEEITGRERDGSVRNDDAAISAPADVETKAVEPEQTDTAPAEVTEAK